MYDSSAGLDDRQGLSANDRMYAGSTYQAIVDAIFAEPYQHIWGAPGEPALPVNRVTFLSVMSGLVRAGSSTQFHK